MKEWMGKRVLFRLNVPDRGHEVHEGRVQGLSPSGRYVRMTAGAYVVEWHLVERVEVLEELPEETEGTEGTQGTEPEKVVLVKQAPAIPVKPPTMPKR